MRVSGINSVLIINLK